MIYIRCDFGHITVFKAFFFAYGYYLKTFGYHICRKLPEFLKLTVAVRYNR